MSDQPSTLQRSRRRITSAIGTVLAASVNTSRQVGQRMKPDAMDNSTGLFAWRILSVIGVIICLFGNFACNILSETKKVAFQNAADDDGRFFPTLMDNLQYVRILIWAASVGSILLDVLFVCLGLRNGKRAPELVHRSPAANLAIPLMIALCFDGMATVSVAMNWSKWMAFAFAIVAYTFEAFINERRWLAVFPKFFGGKDYATVDSEFQAEYSSASVLDFRFFISQIFPYQLWNVYLFFSVFEKLFIAYVYTPATPPGPTLESHYLIYMFIFGAFLSSIFQGYLNRSIVWTIGAGVWFMGLFIVQVSNPALTNYSWGGSLALWLLFWFEAILIFANWAFNIKDTSYDDNGVSGTVAGSVFKTSSA